MPPETSASQGKIGDFWDEFRKNNPPDLLELGEVFQRLNPYRDSQASMTIGFIPGEDFF